ncbi:hypothetical protein PQI66_06560 [Corynebacterium sp. USCH3]|uniref:hypothetical protein n=1 Tax=Corynebacterium sp. USCH3 TaxID=3024840 RepID=UPI0030B34583
MQASPWMRHLMQAEQEGRIPPGAGPLYTRRVVPSLVPVARKDLVAAGMRRSSILSLYTPVTRSLLLPRPLADLPEKHGIDGLDRVFATGRGDDPGLFVHDIVSRARAHAAENPGAMIGGWAALGIHGLPYWADAAPVLLHSRRLSPSGPGRTASASRTPRRPVVRAWPKGVDPVFPDPVVPGLAVVPVEVAAAQCLAAVVGQRHTWFTAGVNGLSLAGIRAVQLIDALRQCTVLGIGELVEGCARRVDADTARRLTDMSDSGAQSPQETLLRLVVRDLLPDGYAWMSQVEVSWGPRRKDRTVLDLACPELKVGLYYDGGSHADRAQRTTDFVQVQELRDMGWETVRADWSLLHGDRGRYLTQVGNALTRAASHHGR